jgi:hypothetical protein
LTKLTNPNLENIPMAPDLIVAHNVTVDRKLLIFDKAIFKSESTTRMPQSFKYDISLPHERSLF